MASCTKRGARRACGVIAVKASVCSTVRLFIIIGPGRSRVNVRENGEILVERFS